MLFFHATKVVYFFQTEWDFLVKKVYFLFFVHGNDQFCARKRQKMSIFDAITDKLRVSFWNKAEKVVLLARFTTNTLWGNTVIYH